MPGCGGAAARSASATTSRKANVIGEVSKTTACGGPAGGADEAEVLLVERLGGGEVVRLQ